MTPIVVNLEEDGEEVENTNGLSLLQLDFLNSMFDKIFARIGFKNRKGKFVEDKKISQKVKNLERTCDLGMILEETFK